MHEPEAALTVFTDLSDLTPDGVDASLGQLLSGRERFYHRPGRRNIFKFALFAEMFKRHPGEVIVWVDADALVLDRVSSQFDPSKFRMSDLLLTMAQRIGLEIDQFADSTRTLSV